MKSFLCLALLLIATSATAKPFIKSFTSEGMHIGVEEVVKGLSIPWGFDFIDGERLLVTERKGTMSLINIKKKTLPRLSGGPNVLESGQGGLLDVAVHPKFKQNKKIFFTYSIPYKGGNTSRLSVATLEKLQLKNVKNLFTAHPESSRGLHFGSRIAFDRKGHIFVTIGDRGYRDRAQELDKHSGKIIRLKLDGSIPTDNPFYNKKGAMKEIWSFGHRNPQGLAFHPKTGELWAQEHGPRGGDEINLVKKGVNYGWPVITYGKEYWGPSIGTTRKKGLAQPVHQFTPSIAPSGLTIYQGKAFPKWQGNLFSGAMKLTHINRLVLGNGNKVVKEERLLDDWGERVRNIRMGPDGLIYFSIDSGKLLKLVPIKK